VVSNLYYSLESYRMKKELRELLVKKNELLQNLLNEGIGIKISDALDTEKDMMLAFSMIQDEENSIAFYKSRIQQFFNASQELNVNFDGLITVAKMISNNQAIKEDSSMVHPSLQYKEAQYRYANANYKLEKAQNMNRFNYFQVGYNRPVYTPEILKKFKPENTLTFRMGITIPFGSNYSFNRNNTNLQQFSAFHNWQSAIITQSKTISIQEARMDYSIKQFRALSEIYRNSVVAKLLSNEKVMAQSTALEILDMKIARKKAEISLWNSMETVSQNYIQLLENKGLLKFSLRHKYLLEN